MVIFMHVRLKNANNSDQFLVPNNKSYLQVLPNDATTRIAIGSTLQVALTRGKKYIKVSLLDEKNNEFTVHLDVSKAAECLHCSTDELIAAEKREAFEKNSIGNLITTKAHELQEESVKHVREVLTAGKETGLTIEEGLQIEGYINSHYDNWNKTTYKDWIKKQKSECLRLPKEETGLPRTLEVFKKDDGTVHVLVLLKTKGNIQILGEGQTKTVKLAINWKTKEPYANLVAKEDDISAVVQEEVLTNSIAGLPGIANKMLFLHQYSSKDGKKKIGYYMHLYEASLKDLLKQGIQLTIQDKMHIAKDILLATRTLLQHHIENRDSKEANIFLEKDASGRYHAYKGDLGYSVYIQETTSPKEFKRKYSDFFVGSPLYLSPEKYFLEDKLFTINDKYNSSRNKDKEAFKDALRNEVKPILDQSQTKTDVWADGIILLRLFTNDSLKDDKETDKSYSYRIYSAIKEAVQSSKGDYTEFNSESLQLKIDAILNEAEKVHEKDLPDGLMVLVRRMITIDPNKRISGEEAYDTFPG